MVELYGINGEFSTEVMKRRLKGFTFKNAGTDFNLEWLKSNYRVKSLPVVIKDNKVLSEEEINQFINGDTEITETVEKPRRKRKIEKDQ